MKVMEVRRGDGMIKKIDKSMGLPVNSERQGDLRN
jgi:hypothetical protein